MRSCGHCGSALPESSTSRRKWCGRACSNANRYARGIYADQRVRMVHDARRRALQAEVPFDLKADDFEIPETCPILGHPLERGHPDWGAQLDRLIPAKGYVPGNVAVISARANRLKSDASIFELEAIVEWLRGGGYNQGD